MQSFRSMLQHLPRRLESVSRRWWIVCALIGLPIFSFACERVRYSSRVLPGVWVGQLAASGMSRQALEVQLKRSAEQLLRQPSTLHVDGLVIRFPWSKIGVSVDVKATAEDALAAGRSAGLFASIGWWVERFTMPQALGYRVRIDESKLLGLVEDWERVAIDDPPSLGSVRGVDGRLVASHPRPGRRIDRKRLLSDILSSFRSSRQSSLAIHTVTVEPSLPPEQVDLALERATRLLKGPVELVSSDGVFRLTFAKNDLVSALTSEPNATQSGLVLGFSSEWVKRYLEQAENRIDSPPVNASFAVDHEGRVRVVPGRPGTTVQAEQVTEALWRAVHAPGLVGQLPVDREAPPEFSTEDARSLGIKKLVASFSTRHACCQPRVQNIHRIAELIDGTVVKPGEVLSVNETVGPRTEKNGFLPAPTIVEGDMEDTVGGGVSQFATTIFNAILHGGYDIVERQPHSYWFPRYPMGHEATLSWPKPDVIFKNDTKSGLLIKTEYTSTRITVKLYGDNEGRKVKVRVSPRQNIIDPPVELVADSSLEPDEEKVRNGGSVGWSVIAGRVITFADGTKKDEQRRVTYSPRTKIIAVHPCRIPEGEEGYTGQDCPEPKDAEILDEDEGGESTSSEPEPEP